MIRFVFGVFIAFALAAPALAERIPSHCVAISQNVPGVQVASLGGLDDLDVDDVRLHYVGHSTFVIETPDGTTIATDFTGFVGSGVMPNVVTMNHAHDSHWTPFPDPAIDHVLRGWVTDGKPADHYLELDEVLVRNVTTNIRNGYGGQRDDDNSIFVFEVAGLCIGHLGHLHHEPSDAQYAMIGRMDVVMAPVDGGMTVPVSTMIKIMKRARASVILPMHWFGDGTLAQFINGMSDEFDVQRPAESHVTVSLRSLPRRPTIVVLNPRPVTAQ